LDQSKWELLFKGVRSGDAVWLKIAWELRPALDTHPGEEMLGAVSTVFDKNPMGALRILLPSYGAEAICSQDEEGSAIDRRRAERRMVLLKLQPASPECQACLGVVERILESDGAR
jgi:hypothetical protein